jgi:dihydrofolate synthase/folylpolyglutamate synthase
MTKEGQFETYQEATTFISNLSHRKVGITEVYAERMKYLLSQLGKPENKLKVVHITGTSGKGSVAALISSIIHASGYSTGLQMSPHLQSVRERTQVDGKYPKTTTYLGLANRVKKAYDKTDAKGSYGTPD